MSNQNENTNEEFIHEQNHEETHQQNNQNDNPENQEIPERNKKIISLLISAIKCIMTLTILVVGIVAKKR